MEEIIKTVGLPEDNGPHNYGVEWWYFNGHLKDKEGKEYSFMDCLFKVDLTKVYIPHILNHPLKNHLQKGEYVYFAHSVVSDISNKKNYKEIQNISLVSADSFIGDKFFVSYKNPMIFGHKIKSEIKELDSNGFHIKTKNLDLKLESRKDPLFEGGHGYVGTPKAGSYYYSLTDMKASGNLNIDKKEIEVEGIAWMDHQWADVEYNKEKKDKWTWFSFQLENGMEIMCVEYSKKDGVDILVDTIDKNGKQSQYKNAILKAGNDIWKSEKTKAEYPQSWHIEIADAEIVIDAHSIVDDQEMIFGQINYWEGSMDIIAQINGDKIKGKGFMELVGYPSDYNYLLLEGEEFEQDILEKLKKFFRKK